MRITISCAAVVARVDSDEVVTDRRVLQRLEGSVLGSDLADYLDPELADLGLVGGDTSMSVDSAGEVRLHLRYWSPAPLAPDQLEKLRAEAIAQWVDGAGEAGFGDSSVRVFATAEQPEVSCVQDDDGREVPPASRVAPAARDGDVEQLRSALESGESPDGMTQGHVALHLAILGGHAAAAFMLLERGANAAARKREGGTALHFCATASRLVDADASRLAIALLRAGCPLDACDDLKRTALELARIRKKSGLVDVLSGS